MAASHRILLSPYTYNPTWSSFSVEVTPKRLPWLCPLFAFFPHSLAYCPHCSQLASTFHCNIAYRQVRDHSFFTREGGLVGFRKHHLKIA